MSSTFEYHCLHKDIIDIFRFMFIIRYPYSHQYKRVIVIVYWSEYLDEVSLIRELDHNRVL